MKLFTIQSYDPKLNAQQNLAGRTHYVDDATLRYHKSKILQAHILHGGLILSLIESVALDPQNQTRGFRPVVFDLFGTVLSCMALADCRKSRRAAEIAMWAHISVMDAKKLTLQAIKEQTAIHRAAMRTLAAKVKAL